MAQVTFALFVFMFGLLAGCSSFSRDEHAKSRIVASNEPVSNEDLKLGWNIPFEQVKISSALDELISLKNNPDAPASSSILKDDEGAMYVNGTLSYVSNNKSHAVKIKVYLRGQTSLFDCEFPKLKIKWKSSDVIGSPLENISGWRVNSHCSSKGGYTEMGRFAGERGPVREHFVYQIQDAFGLTSFKNRLAQITYQNSSSQKELTSFALILENNKDASKRLQGEIVEEEDIDRSEDEYFEKLQKFYEGERNKMHKIALFQSFILNFDYGIRMLNLEGTEYVFGPSPMPLFRNMIYLKRGGQGRDDIFPTDFDVSGLVTQRSYRVPSDTQKMLGCTSWICLTQFDQLQKWRSFFTRQEWAEVIDSWNAIVKIKILDLIKKNSSLTVDEKKVFNTSVVAFDLQLSSLYKYPVVTEGVVKVFKTESGKFPCGEEDPVDRTEILIPSGTPMFILSKGALRTKVKIFEVYSDTLTNPITFENCLNDDDTAWVENKDLKYISTDWPR